MQRKTRKQTNSNTVVKDFVTVAFAEDMELARQYQELLDDNGISAHVKRQPEMAESGFSDIAILVPEDSLDAAHSLISERANYDDFFDRILDDRGDESIDGLDLDLDDDDDLY
jgi:hypothetical protein